MSRVLKRESAFWSAGSDGWPDLAPAEGRAAAPARKAAAVAAVDPWEEIRRRLSALREQARREGYEEGYREGLAAAERRLRGALGAVRRLLLRALEERAREDADLADALVELARSLAERVLADALAENPERLVAMAREAAAALGPAEEVEVRVHPRDVAAVAAAGQVHAFRFRLRVVEDPALEPGDLLLVSRRGRVDLRVRRQVQRLLEAAAEEVAADADG